MDFDYIEMRAELEWPKGVRRIFSDNFNVFNEFGEAEIFADKPLVGYPLFKGSDNWLAAKKRLDKAE